MTCHSQFLPFRSQKHLASVYFCSIPQETVCSHYFYHLLQKQPIGPIMLFRVRHFFIPPFPTSLSRTFNRFKKEGRKITVNLYNSETDKYSESPLLDPQASFSNMSQKEKYSLLELLYFLADSSTFFRFF